MSLDFQQAHGIVQPLFFSLLLSFDWSFVPSADSETKTPPPVRFASHPIGRRRSIAVCKSRGEQQFQKSVDWSPVWGGSLCHLQRVRFLSSQQPRSGFKRKNGQRLPQEPQLGIQRGCPVFHNLLFSGRLFIVDGVWT